MLKDKLAEPVRLKLHVFRSKNGERMKRISKWSFLVNNSTQRFFCLDANIGLSFEKLANIIFLEQNGFDLRIFQSPFIAFCAI
jgi:hypothetical protein